MNMQTTLIIFFIGVIVVSVLLLKGFDRLAGRGPKQIRDGVNSSKMVKKESRIACPECAEMIKIEAKKCRFCGVKIKK